MCSSDLQPYLYVAVTGLSFDGGKAWAVALRVELRQSVKSAVTESRIVDAVTWDQHTVLVLPARQLPDLRAEIASLVATFVDDWRTVRRHEGGRRRWPTGNDGRAATAGHHPLPVGTEACV